MKPVSSIRNFLKLRSRIDAYLGLNHHHFCNYVPSEIGFFSTLMLKSFFSGVRLDKQQIEQIKEIPPDAILVYANKYKSPFEFLFSYTRLKAVGARYPQLGLNLRTCLWQPVPRLLKIFFSHLDSLLYRRHWPDIYSDGYVESALTKGAAGFISLVDKRGFYLRFVKAQADPIEHLVLLQQKTQRPIYIVPQLIFFGKTPRRAVPGLRDAFFGSRQDPSMLRKLVILFRKPGKVFAEMSEPFNLQAYLSLPENKGRPTEQSAVRVRQRLLHQLDRHRQSITGPLIKSKEETKQAILTGDRLKKFMAAFAESRDQPLLQVHKKAAGYIDEISANYSPAAINVMAKIVAWIINTMFDGAVVNYDVLNRVKNMSTRGPLVLLPCHKSHIDYLILSYILYINNMPCPHIAAGKNLSFWPLGPLFRWGGAFFIRRTFRGAVLYSRVFQAYMYKLLEDGFNIEFFIEGGRSRTGKLIMPKLGLLSILLDVFNQGACEDLILVPVYIGYDRVLEERAYVSELEGGQKEPENLRQVIEARKFLKKRYGKIYIKFNQPLSLKSLLRQNGVSLQQLQPEDQRRFCSSLGHRIIYDIDRMTVVTPHALVAAAMLNCGQKRFSYAHLLEHVDTYLRYLNTVQATLADTLAVDPVQAVEQVIETYLQRKLIERADEEPGDQLASQSFKIRTQRRQVLDYYKNNTISFFIPAAFTALSILQLDAFQFATADIHPGYRFLQSFFRQDFSSDWENSPEFHVRKTIKALINDAVLIPHPSLPETYNITSSGFRELRLFASFLKSFLESYWIVLSYLQRNRRSGKARNEHIKRIEARGMRMYRRREISRYESLSRINYVNAYAFFSDQGISSAEDLQKIEEYTNAIQQYLKTLPS